MKNWPATLVLLFSGVAMASEPSSYAVRRGTLELLDLSTVEVANGCWLAEGKCISQAKRLADAEARTAYLEAHSGDVPTAIAVIFAAIGLATGIIAVEVADVAKPR